MRAVGPKIDKGLLFRQLSLGLSPSDKSQLIKLRRHAPRWAQDIIHQLEATIDGQMGDGTTEGQRGALHRNSGEKGHFA
jgi:hypothetical protein